MTIEEKRIKIAEACGLHVCPWCWHRIDPDTCHCGSRMDSHGYGDGHSGVPMGCTCGYHDADKRKAKQPECPDYFNDLNAVHKAEEKLLVSDHWDMYERQLMWSEVPDAKFPYWRCTAPQRGEALGRTLQLWPD